MLTKNDHNSTQKAPKSITPQEIKSAGHSPSSGSVKSDLKQFSKSDHLGFAGAVFHGFLPPEGDLTKKLYRHKVKDFLIKISFGICSKQLLTMRNRFLIFQKPEKLNFNEFLRFKVLKTDENVVFSKKCRKTILRHAILCKKMRRKRLYYQF